MVTTAAKPLRIGPVAEVLGLHYTTVGDYCRAGEFPGAFQTPGGHWRFPGWAVEAMKARLGVRAEPEPCETKRARAKRTAAAMERIRNIK